MNTTLDQKRVAILAADGFEYSELTEPMKALQQAGAKISVVSPKAGKIQGVTKGEKAGFVDVDIELNAAKTEDFDALLLPGGLKNPDTLRALPEAVTFVRTFGNEGKPIAAICHGPWLLIEAGLASGRRLTSWPAIQTDVRNAGGTWEDAEVVVDGAVVTSRKPDDIPAFNLKMIEVFAAGRHAPLGEAAIPPAD
jgi:protease I